MGGGGATLLFGGSARFPVARRGGGRNASSLFTGVAEVLPGTLLGSGGGGGTIDRVDDVEAFDSERRTGGLIGFGGAALRIVCLRWAVPAAVDSMSMAVAGLGGFGGALLWAVVVVVLVKAGGSFLGSRSSLGRDTLPTATLAARKGGVSGFSTFTQSGSAVGLNGLDGRSEFGRYRSLGGLTVERAGMPLSSHHFLLSELAGGRPGSTESYPYRLSSSLSAPFDAV